MHAHSRARRPRRVLTRSLLTLALGGLALTTAACGHDPATSRTSSRAPAAWPSPASADASYQAVPGAPLGPAAGSVRLTDGTSWRYRDAAPGTLTLLYFGYTNCPDVCPLTMADLARAEMALTPAQRAHLRVLFVSTDPHRDSPARLRDWLAGFDPSFVGGRASVPQVIAAARTYGISIDPPKVTASDYEVAHGAEVVVLRPGGGMVGYFRSEATWRAYAAALPTLLRRDAGVA